jgi:hypothetical protein
LLRFSLSELLPQSF